MNSNFSCNQDLLTRSLRSVWHSCPQMKHHEQMPLVPIARGDGMWLYDFEGNRYLDAISSGWVNLFEHANPRINAALADQLGRLEHVILAVLDRGLLLRPLGNTDYFMPPYVIEEDHMDMLVGAICETLDGMS